MILERIFNGFPGDKITPHSLRRTVATQLVELSFADKPLLVRILNHTPQGVTDKHYIGAKEMDKIKSALQQWAGYLDRLKAGLEDRVVEISTYKKVV